MDNNTCDYHNYKIVGNNKGNKVIMVDDTTKYPYKDDKKIKFSKIKSISINDIGLFYWKNQNIRNVRILKYIYTYNVNMLTEYFQ